MLLQTFGINASYYKVGFNHTDCQTEVKTAPCECLHPVSVQCHNQTSKTDKEKKRCLFLSMVEILWYTYVLP